MIKSHDDCIRALLLASIFFEKIGLSSDSNAMGRVAAFLEVRGAGASSDLPAASTEGSGTFDNNLRCVYRLVTLTQPSRYQRKTFGEPRTEMNRHDWMDDVLRDVIAYAVLNKMPEVARYVALGLDALHLHMHDQERREARSLYATQSFQLEALNEYSPATVDVPVVAAETLVGESRSELR